jgi:hypothetical protein
MSWNDVAEILLKADHYYNAVKNVLNTETCLNYRFDTGKKTRKKHTGGGGNALIHYVAEPRVKLTEIKCKISNMCGTFT